MYVYSNYTKWLINELLYIPCEIEGFIKYTIWTQHNNLNLNYLYNIIQGTSLNDYNTGTDNLFFYLWPYYVYDDKVLDTIQPFGHFYLFQSWILIYYPGTVNVSRNQKPNNLFLSYDHAIASDTIFITNLSN